MVGPINLRRAWHNLLLLGAVAAILVGLWAFTMTITVWLWVAIVVAVVLLLYFATERFFGWGTGRRATNAVEDR